MQPEGAGVQEEKSHGGGADNAGESDDDGRGAVVALEDGIDDDRGTEIVRANRGSESQPDGAGMVEENGEETDADGEPGNLREGARVAIDHGFDDQESERATSDQRGESGRSPEGTQDAASALTRPAFNRVSTVAKRPGT